MADERPQQPHPPQQIREGAGLEESRLSQDTIDLLTKWGWPLLMVLAVIGLGYSGMNYLKQKRLNRVDAAFTQLASAQQSQSPDSLLGVAQDFDDVAGVSILARMGAADIHLHSARARQAPGTTDLNPDGTPKEAAALNDDQRKAQLDSAQKLYQQVADETAGKAPQVMQHIGALFGLAAVAECREDWEGAKGLYTRIADQATAAKLPDLATAAKARRESVDSLKTMPKLFAASELYGAPKPPPPPPPAPPATATPTPAPTAAPVAPPITPAPAAAEPATGSPPTAEPKPTEPAPPTAPPPAPPPAPPTPAPSTPPSNPSTPPGR